MAADWPGATKATDALARMLDRFDLLPGRFELAGDETGKEADIENPDDLRELFHESGLLVSAGRPVLVYIRDHIVMTPDPLTPEECRKVHFTVCRTLQRMADKGHFERYRRTMSESNIYVIDVSSSRGRVSEVRMRLDPCKNCLDNVRYAGYSHGMRRHEKQRIVKAFDARVIMEAMRRHLRRFSKRDAAEPFGRLARVLRELMDRAVSLDPAGSPSGYRRSFQKTAQSYKDKMRWICEDCGVSLYADELRYLLHVHHRNGVKYDDTESNLQALCVLCHQKRHQHPIGFDKGDERKVRRARKA